MVDTRSPQVELTVVGLGSGRWQQLTIAALQALEHAQTVWLPSDLTFILPELQSHLPNTTFAELSSESPPTASAELLIAEAAAGKNPCLGVLGSGTESEALLHDIRCGARSAGIAVQIVAGRGLPDIVLECAQGTTPPWSTCIWPNEIERMMRANAIGESDVNEQRMPWRAPNVTEHLVIPAAINRDTYDQVMRWLMNYYPANHEVALVDVYAATCKTVTLDDKGEDLRFGPQTALSVVPLTTNDDARTFGGIMQVTRRLRAAGGCPWDREQTHQSLKPHLLEEAYEVLDALDSGKSELIAEELGDLLFQITIHSQIAAEQGTFTVEDVIENIVRKLVGRHPHVFGDMELESAQDVLHVWETFKQKEKPKRTSVLEQIPRGLPALPQSNLIQKRAASVGFEWPDVNDVMTKVREELDELQHEIEQGAAKELQREEYGDILFAMVSVARRLKIDPEEALRLANRKFAARFQYVESRATAAGLSLRELGPAELDKFWEEAKALGTERPPTARMT